MFSLLNNQNSGGFSKKYIEKHQPSVFQVAKDALMGRDDPQTLFYDETKSKCLLFRGNLTNTEDLYVLIEEYDDKNSKEHIILLLYKHFGIEKTLELIDGQYAFFLYDNNFKNEQLDCTEKFYVACDPFGQIPLYQIAREEEGEAIYGFAHNPASLAPFLEKENGPIQYTIPTLALQNPTPDYGFANVFRKIVEHKRGTFTTLELSFKVLSSWKITQNNQPFYHFPKISYRKDSLSNMEHNLRIQSAHCAIERAIVKRVYDERRWSLELNCVGVAEAISTSTTYAYGCLLSGGVYSSIVAALLNDHIQTFPTSIPPLLHTFNIVYKGQTGRQRAREMAEYIHSEHHEIFVDYEPENKDVVALVYQHIEELGLSIRSLFHGMGARTLTQKRGPDQGWVEYESAIRSELQKVILPDSNQLPIPLFAPFLDTSFVESFLHIPPQTRCPNSNQNFIRTLFWCGYYLNKNKDPLLPYSLMWHNDENQGRSQETNHIGNNSAI